MNNKLLKNNIIIIIFCILGIYLYLLCKGNKTEEQLFFIVGYVSLRNYISILT